MRLVYIHIYIYKSQSQIGSDLISANAIAPDATAKRSNLLNCGELKEQRTWLYILSTIYLICIAYALQGDSKVNYSQLGEWAVHIESFIGAD